MALSFSWANRERAKSTLTLFVLEVYSIISIIFPGIKSLLLIRFYL